MGKETEKWSKSPQNNHQTRPVYNIRDFGAQTIDTIPMERLKSFTPADHPDKFAHFAINKAIEQAHQAGGGTVYVPSGTWLIGSIRMKSYVTLYLENGSVLQAAQNGIDAFTHWEHDLGNPIYATEDFGRVHMRASVIWALNEKHMTIKGDGILRSWTDGYGGITNSGMDSGRPNPLDPNVDLDTYLPRFPQGDADKTIAFQQCTNITIKDITILQGGHFGIILVGCENGNIRDVLIDTNRDGINLDCCRNFRITGCTINSMCDDGICIKSPSSLGYMKPSQNITISDCILYGYDFGSVYDQTYTQKMWVNKETGVPYSKTHGTGRIKLGTKSAGGFRNITVTNCVFENSRGFCIEGVDGGDIENITFSNILMRKCTNSPIFIRLGGRQRTIRKDPPIARITNIQIHDVTVVQTPYSSRNFSSLILGLNEDHKVENINISDYRLVTKGGGTEEMKDNKVPMNDARWFPKRDENGEFIEVMRDGKKKRLKVGTGSHYPEPHNFVSDRNPAPAWGFFVRYAKNITFDNVMMETEKADARNSIIFDHAEEVTLDKVYERNPDKKAPASMEWIKSTQYKEKGSYR